MHEIFQGVKVGDELFCPKLGNMTVSYIGRKYANLLPVDIDPWIKPVVYSLETAKRTDGRHERLYRSQEEWEEELAQREAVSLTLEKMRDWIFTHSLSREQVLAIGKIIGTA